MKILLITVCWNEAPIVPFFLTHYGSMCDKIIAYDNGSTDGTTELLAAHSRVDVRNSDTGGNFDNARHIAYKNEAWKEYRDKYDWVICCDFDEFLYHPRLAEKLAEFKKAGITTPSILGFSMKSFTFPADADKPILEQVTYGKFDKHFSKNLIFDPKALEDTGYQNGCHQWQPVGNVRYSDEPLYLLHFKKLGREYEKQKAIAYCTKELLHQDGAGNIVVSQGYRGLISQLPRRYARNNPIEKENHEVIKAIERGEWDSKIKNVVLTVCDYPEKTITPFIESWLESMRDQKPLTDLVIFTPNWKWIERQGPQNRTGGRIWFVPFERDDTQNIITQRWVVYADYLESTANRYDNVLLTDCRDVLFQTGNIFEGLEQGRVDVYGEDSANYPDPVSDKWQRDAYKLACGDNAQELKTLIQGEYYCAGVVAGSRDNMHDLCKRMTSLLESRAKAPAVRKEFAYETGVFNLLVKCNAPGYLRHRDNHSGDVLSMARIMPDGRPHPPFPFVHDGRGEITNTNGKPFPIVHFNGMKSIPARYLKTLKKRRVFLASGAQDTRRVCVVTVAVGDAAREVAGISMPFLADYCIRCGYDLKVITQTGEHMHPVWTRFDALALLDDYDLVMYIDNDVIVKYGSPPITESLPVSGWDFAAFDSGEYLYMHARAKREYQERAAFLGVECPPTEGEEYLNAGVCVFAQTMRDYAPKETLIGYRDQTAIAFDWLRGDLSWHKLPREWNWGHLNKFGNTKAALERDDVHFVHWTGVPYEHGRARSMRDFATHHRQKMRVTA